MADTPFIVVICGGSGSGKTTLINAVAERFASSQQVARLSTDDYYRDLGHLSLQERRQNNFDHPDALDLELFLVQLKMIHSGSAVEVPIYDFKTHTRQGTRTLAPPGILFVDGIFSLFPEDIRQHINFAVFLDIPDQVRFERRLKRDMQERNRSEVEVRTQYERTVRPMYETFVNPTMAKADLVISLDQQLEKDLVDQLTKAISARLL